MGRDLNQTCLQVHLEAELRHDMVVTLATLHPECVFVDEPLGMRFLGRDGARQHYEMWWNGLGATLDSGDLHWAGDDLVIGDAAFVGCHTGTFAGIAPTGRSIRLPFVVFVRFEDGLFASERFAYDLNGLLQRLGGTCLRAGGYASVAPPDSIEVFQAWPPGFRSLLALERELDGCDLPSELTTGFRS